MTKLEFETLRFEEKEDHIKAVFLRMFSFNIQKSDLDRIGKWKIGANSIEFFDVSDKKVTNKFNQIMHTGFENLKNMLNGKQTVYVHRNSGIPIMGNVGFGS